MGQDTDLVSAAKWRGRQLESSDGAVVGKVEAVLYDFVSSKPIWVGVSSGPFGVHTALVPVRDTSAEGDRLRAVYSKAVIEEQPPLDVGEAFDSLTGEHKLYDYFGVPFDEHSDVRVLHRDTELPGLERTTE
jgi:PRC-barrel domain